MRRVAALVIPALALLVSACGSSSTNTATHAATVTGTHPTTTTSPSTTSTSSTTQTTSSTPSPCRAANLSLSFLGGQGAAGHGELGFALRNTSGTTCSTIGYPGIQFLGQAGGALPTIPTHTTHDFFGSVPKALLNVAPGATVSFRLGVTHGAASPTGCTTAYGLQVIPPNDTASLRTTIPNGAYECQMATVSPLAPGTSAYSGPGPNP